MELNLEVFIDALEKELDARYQVCNDGIATTPSTILLTVLNAISDARAAAVADAIEKQP